MEDLGGGKTVDSEDNAGGSTNNIRTEPLGVGRAIVPVSPKAYQDAEKVISAARSGDIDFLKKWVESGGDLQRKLDNSFVSWTPLQLACAEGDSKAVETLLKAGADPNFNDGHDGYGALHIAARYGQHEIITTLIAAGAMPNITDALGHTALHYAATSGSAPTAKVILESGVDLEMANEDNHTALELAVVQNSVQVADLIRAKRAESWARTDNAVANWLQTIELPQYADLLLSQGWDDINFISSVGFTEFDLDKLGIKKGGHRRKLLSKFRANEFASYKPPDVNKDAGSDDSGSDDDSDDSGSDDDSDESDSDSD